MITHIHDSHGARFYLTRQTGGGFWHLQGPGLGPGVFLHCYHNQGTDRREWRIYGPLGRGDVWPHWQECINACLDRVLPVEVTPCATP